MKIIKILFRQQQHFRGLSFEAISAVGSNAAMAHYSPTEGNDVAIDRDHLYLLDSGGQYFDGTTGKKSSILFRALFYLFKISNKIQPELFILVHRRTLKWKHSLEC